MVHMAHDGHYGRPWLNVLALFLYKFYLFVEFEGHRFDSILRKQLELIGIGLSAELLKLLQDHVSLNVK